MAQTSLPAPRTRRVTLIVSLSLVAALALGSLWLLWYRQLGMRQSVINTANQLAAKGQSPLAIRHLGRYLATNPDDVPVLELMAKLQTESVTGVEDLLAAAATNDRLCRIDPNGKGRQESRQRLADLYIKYSDYMTMSPLAGDAPGLAAREYRYQAAETVARDMLAREKTNAAAHRLLARALEGLAGPGDAAVIEDAARQYEAALELDPKDKESAERLARIDDERRKDPAAAQAVLDRLEKALPGSAEVRLIRYMRATRVGQADQAAAELAAALKLDPGSTGVRLAAAEDALRRIDPGAARRHLDALPKAKQAEPRVRLIRGLADFIDDKPDEAIAEWRARLMSSGGTDVEMTWYLAMNLIRAGRVVEAKPLVDQYSRLIGDAERPEFKLLVALYDERSGLPNDALQILNKLTDREKLDPAYLPEIEMAIGRCHLALRDETGAEAAFRRAVKANPKAAAPRRELARLLQRRRPDEEVAELRRGLAVSPNSAELKVALADALIRQQARVAPGRRSWTEADPAIAAAAAAQPGSLLITRLQARRRELDPEHGGVAGALALLSAAASRSPDSSAIWIDWALTLERAGRRSDAIAVIEKAPADNVQVRMTDASLLAAAGRKRDARTRLERGIERLSPDQQQALWKALGDLLVELGDRDEAKLAYDRWLRSSPPGDPRPRLFMMGLAMQVKDFAAAQAYLDALEQQLGKGDLMARMARSELLLKSSAGAADSDPRPAAALALLDDVLSDAPNVPEAHVLRAEALARKGRIDDAIVACQRARNLGLDAATPILVRLMASRRRFEDLDRLPRTGVALDRLAAEAALAANEPSWASRFVERVAESGDDSVDVLAWRARMYERLGRLGEADAILLTLAERRPTELEPWLELVRAQARRGRYGAIAAIIERAKAQVKSDSPEMVEALCLWARGDRKAAEQAFAAVLRKRPDDVRALLAASAYLWTLNRFDLAEAGYRRVLALEPGNREAKRGLAVVMANASRSPEGWERAWETLNAGLKGPSAETLSDRVARAVLLSKAPDANRRAQAIGLLEALRPEVPDASPEAALLRDSLIRLLLQTGQADRACEVAAVPESRANDAASLSALAETLIQAGRKPAAAEALDRLVKAYPGNAQEAILRVRLLWDPAKPAESAKQLERAYLDRGDSPGAEPLGRVVFAQLAAVGSDAVAEKVGRQLATRDPGLSWMPAKILGRRGRSDEALEFCRLAIEAGSNADISEAIRVAQTIAFADPTKVEAVGPLIEAARKRDPDQIDIRLAEGTVLHLRGDYAAEVRLYRELLASQPDEIALLNNLAWALSEGIKQPGEALEVIDKVIAIQGRLPATMDTRGVILTRLKRYPEAIEDLKAAVRAEPKPGRYYHLARAYQLAGDPEQFRQNREAAKRAGLQIDMVDPCERVECASLMEP